MSHGRLTSEKAIKTESARDQNLTLGQASPIVSKLLGVELCNGGYVNVPWRFVERVSDTLVHPRDN